jgi:hypothetical protein
MVSDPALRPGVWRRRLVALLGALAACQDPTGHVYTAQLFERDRGCLDPSTAVDVIDGAGAATLCGPVCLLQASPDGGVATYVSPLCPPYPQGFDGSGHDPSCAAALAAFGRGDVCQADGGSTHPLADAGLDGSADATPE